MRLREVRDRGGRGFIFNAKDAADCAEDAKGVFSVLLSENLCTLGRARTRFGRKLRGFGGFGTQKGHCFAKRMECVQLAGALVGKGVSKAGASSTHSKRFARFGCGLPR